MGTELKLTKVKNIICGSISCDSSSFRIAIQDTGFKRVILDCKKCYTRILIPIDEFSIDSQWKPSWDFIRYSEEPYVIL